LTFQSFWDQFENLINQQTIPDSIKFTHLLSLLEGEAKSALEGIPVTNENYQEAVTILKNRFGNMQTVRRILYSRIQNLTKCSHDLESIKQFADTLEKTCRQLRNIDENPDQTALIFVVQEKLPYELVEELVKSKPVNDSWTMATLQNSLKQYIAVKEEVSDVLGDAKYRMKIERRYQSNGQIKKKMNAIEQTFNNRNGPAMKEFALCADPHIANECSTQAEVMPRRQCIDGLRLCFRCHKAGDQIRHNTYRKWRYSCRENRHSDPFLSVDNFYYDEDRPNKNQVYRKKREINPAFIDSPVIYQEQTKECFRKDQQILRNDMRRSKNLLVDRHIHNDTSYAQEQTSKLRPNRTLNRRTEEFVRPRQASTQ
uniref:Retrotrans_gag domain-containing protein n=1 Tax=Anisakis simplex TaxID=6269 RepID=A0A0M3JAV2_ANISI